MHRTEGENHKDNLFTDGPPPSVITPEWMNAVQEELANVIEQSGSNVLTQGNDTHTQLYEAIQRVASANKTKLTTSLVCDSGVNQGDVVRLRPNGEIESGVSENTVETPVVFESADSSWVSIARLTDSKFVVCYRDVGNSNYGTCIIGTVSNGIVTFGTAVVFESATSNDFSVARLTDSKFVVCYADNGNSSYGTSIIADVSGTVPTFGTAVVFESASSGYISVARLTDSKFVVCYHDNGNLIYGTCIVATVSGTVPTFGTAVVFETSDVDDLSITRLTDFSFSVCYSNTDNSSFGTFIVGTVLNNIPTFGTAVVFESADTNYTAVTHLTSDNIAVCYQDTGNSNYGTSAIVSLKKSIGVSQLTTSTGNSANITTSGISDIHESLTKGLDYYSDDGVTLNTDGNGLLIGKAISATEILLDNSTWSNLI